MNPAPGTVITIPSQMLLPDTEREGIVVNLAELRLTSYPPGENIVQVYPLGYWSAWAGNTGQHHPCESENP
ncbi:hypothetical protein ACVXG7_20995 [Enterobacter hormaechei]